MGTAVQQTTGHAVPMPDWGPKAIWAAVISQAAKDADYDHAVNLQHPVGRPSDISAKHAGASAVAWLCEPGPGMVEICQLAEIDYRQVIEVARQRYQWKGKANDKQMDSVSNPEDGKEGNQRLAHAGGEASGL